MNFFFGKEIGKYYVYLWFKIYKEVKFKPDKKMTSQEIANWQRKEQQFRQAQQLKRTAFLKEHPDFLELEKQWRSL